MLEIIQAVKSAELKREFRLFVEGEPTTVTFLADTHDNAIQYYTESGMELKSFEHWTSLYSHTFLYICKGFIAGKGWTYQ